MDIFNKEDLIKLYKPPKNSNGEDNGQVTIIGGSKLFHGAPLFSLKAASRIVDMVFFASPEPSLKSVVDKMKSSLLSFIWVPWDDANHYVEKSDASLIGPGFMRFGSENTPHKNRHQDCDEECQITRSITQIFLQKFPSQKWVIDAGSLQVMDPAWIPQSAIITPNKKEFEILFQLENSVSNAKLMAEKYGCVIVLKGPETVVCSPKECVLVKGGNAGMTKGGTGDVLAGLTVALLAKNQPLLAATAASCIAKAAADELFEKVGTNYNSDDLADAIPSTFAKLTS